MQGGETLRDTGRLMNSYTHNVLSNGVEVGTDVAYAPHLHYGATILPKNGQYITPLQLVASIERLSNQFYHHGPSSVLMLKMKSWF
jgi:hypothetical protein